MFCRTCLGALQKLKRIAHRYDDGSLRVFHHANVADLKATANQNYWICHAFWSTYSADGKALLLQADEDFHVRVSEDTLN